jgi:hypothetical protein
MSRRKQKIADRSRVNGFARLYGTIRTIQHEIESQMSDFEELMEELVYVSSHLFPFRSVLSVPRLS